MTNYIIKLPSGGFIDLMRYARLSKNSLSYTLHGFNGAANVSFPLADADALKIVDTFNLLATNGQ